MPLFAFAFDDFESQNSHSTNQILTSFVTALSRRELNQTMLAYDLMSAWWLTRLTASTFKWVGEYVSSPRNQGLELHRTHCFIP